MSILSEELANDPEALGYSTMTDAEVVVAINTVDRTVNRASISGSELLDQTDATEYSSRTAEQKANWLSLCGIDSIDPFGSAVQVAIDVWGGGSQTIINLQAVRVETLSRAQELGLSNIYEATVARARG